MKRKTSFFATAISVFLFATIAGCGTSASQPATPGAPTPAPTAPAPAPAPTPAPAPAPVPDAHPPTPVDTSHDYEAAAVHFQTSQTGFVGGNGFIFHTEDGGRHWDAQYQGDSVIQQFSFVDEKTGFALGSQNTTQTLLQTTDGGLHWNVVGHPQSLPEIHFTSASVGFGGAQMTQDGGKTWTALKTPQQTVGTPYFSDEKNGWALTTTESQFQVRHTTDGGATWTTALTKNLQYGPVPGGTIRATSASDAWVTVYGGTGMTQTSYSLFHTRDAGATWQPVIAHSTAGGGTAPGYTDPTSTGPKGPGTKPGELDAIDSNHAVLSGNCPACAGMGTVSTGHTEDGGKTWSNSAQMITGNGGEISFVDAKKGWLLASAVQSASVLYATEDGGKTWTKEFVFGTHEPPTE